MAAKMSISDLKKALKKKGLSDEGTKKQLVERYENGGDEEPQEEGDLDPSTMTVPELKAALKARKLPVGGKKSDLVERLQEALGGGGEEAEAEAEAEAEEEEEKPKKKAPKAKKAAKAKEPEPEEEGEEEEEEEEPPKKATKRKAEAEPAAAKGGAKKAKTGTRKVDPSCRLGSAEVHEDYDCMLNQTNIGGNNNKFYRIQVLKSGASYYNWTHWGRVGEEGQNKLENCGSVDKAIKSFEKKFKDKTKNNWADRANFRVVSGKYTLLEMDTGDDDEDVDATLEALSAGGAEQKYADSTLDKQTQALIKLIFDHDMFKQAMAKLEIDVKKMPLGKLSKGQLAKGFEVLEEIEDIIKNGAKGNLVQLSSQFYTLIPHSFGRAVPPPIKDAESLQRKFDMLAVLGDVAAAQGLVKNMKATGKQGVLPHPLDSNYGLLKCKLTSVSPKSKEFKIIETYLEATKGGRGLVIEDVWELDREGEGKRFAEHEDMGNRRLLWHGTNVAVVVAILSSGLRIMPHAGGRVGKGLYFASENSKSASYVRPAGKTGIMFLAEVALGKEKHITKDDSSLVRAPPGFDSIIAQGRTEPDPKLDTSIEIEGNSVAVPQGPAKPRAEYASSSFSQTEYLVYKESQQRLRYMLKIKFP